MSKGLGEHFNSLDLGLTKPEIDDPLITLVVLVHNYSVLDLQAEIYLKL